MKTTNDLVALRNKMRNMIYAAASIEMRVMVREAEVRRPSLLTSPFGTNRSRSAPLFPELESTKETLLHENKKIQGFGLNKISIT